MQTDLSMSSGGYSLVLSIFYVSYLLFEVPSNMLITHSSPKIFLPAIMFTWVCALCCTLLTPGCHLDRGQGYPLDRSHGRLPLRSRCRGGGLLPRRVFPYVMLVQGKWPMSAHTNIQPEEMSKRQTIFYSATLVAGAFGGLLAGGIMQGMEGLANTRGWRWLFMIEGLATCVVAVGAYFVLPSEPHSLLCADIRLSHQHQLAH